MGTGAAVGWRLCQNVQDPCCDSQSDCGTHFESVFGEQVEKQVEWFGSLQHDVCLPDSDIDLCIVVNKKNFKNEAAVLQPVFQRLRLIGHSLNANSIDMPPGFSAKALICQAHFLVTFARVGLHRDS